MDPNIKWEETEAFNIGLDFGFFDQRLTGAIDWYDKSTEDLLFTVPVAAFSNFSNFVTTNVGTMRNRGFEFSLGARILQNDQRGLNWQADFTPGEEQQRAHQHRHFGARHSRSSWARSREGSGTRIQVLTPGQPVNSFYVYEHIRENGQPIYRDVNGDRVDGTPNDVINEQDLYVDQNGDGIINQDDLRPFHDPAPKWILGPFVLPDLRVTLISGSRCARTSGTTCTTTFRPTWERTPS